MRDATFLATLNDLLDRWWPPAMRGGAFGRRAAGAAERALWKALDARGWLSPGWPREHGGRDWPAERQLAFQRACAAAEVPWPSGQRLGPALWRHGSADQVRRHLEAARSGAVRWGYSLDLELAAAPVAGGFRLSGATRVAADAEWLAALAGSGSEAVLLLVELPPARRSEVVRFAGRLVPAAQRLGADGRDAARSIAIAPLPLAGSVSLQRRLAGLRRMRGELDQGEVARPSEDVDMARRFEALGVGISALGALEERLARAADPALDGILAVTTARLERDLGNLIVDLLGYHALPSPTGLAYHNEAAIDHARPEWVHQAFAAMAGDGYPEWRWIDALWAALESPGAG